MKFRKSFEIEYCMTRWSSPPSLLHPGMLETVWIPVSVHYVDFNTELEAMLADLTEYFPEPCDSSSHRISKEYPHEQIYPKI